MTSIPNFALIISRNYITITAPVVLQPKIKPHGLMYRLRVVPLSLSPSSMNVDKPRGKNGRVKS